MTYVVLSARLWATGARTSFGLTTQNCIRKFPLQLIKFNIRNRHSMFEKCSNRAYNFLSHYNSFQLNHLKDCLVQNLTIFTKSLHKQSNVYFCLRLRQITQIFNLYHRIYSPKDFRLIFHHSINKVNRIKLFLRNIFRSRFLMSFASVSLFSWEDNKITDKEIKDLVEDFLSFEKLNSSDDSDDEIDGDNSRNRKNNNEKSSSFMIINYLDADDGEFENWDLIINQPHFHVWRKPVNNSSLYEYKVFGTFYDVSSYSFYIVQRDLDYRKTWDDLVIRLDIVNQEPESVYEKLGKFIDDSRNEIVHWIMKYPYPMKSREYLFVRRSRIDYERNFIVILSRAVEYPDLPESNEYVRVYDYFSQMVIKPHGNSIYETGFDYMLTYFDNPRASFPSPAYNWMASRGVPEFLKKMHQASIKFSEIKKYDLIEARKEEEKIRLKVQRQRLRSTL